MKLFKVFKSNICDFNDAYILVRGDITVMGNQVTQVAFKNWWKNNRWCWRFRFSHANVKSKRIKFKLFWNNRKFMVI